jgi:hypothetical protein
MILEKSFAYISFRNCHLSSTHFQIPNETYLEGAERHSSHCGHHTRQKMHTHARKWNQSVK